MNKERLFRDTTIKILSLIFAVLLWFYVITEQNPVVPKDITIPVRIINLEALNKNNLVMVENPDGYYITLKLKGKKEVLDTVSRNTLNAFADINNYTNLGENIVPVAINGLPDGVTITSRSEHSIKVTLDRKLVVQKPITVNVTGNPLGGMANLEPIVAPSEVVLSGAQSIMDRIKTVRVDVDIAGVSANVTKSLPVRLLDENGNEVIGVQINTPEVNVTVPVANTKRVPIQLIMEGTAAEGYMIVDKLIQPREILVTGDQQALDSLTAISTTPIIINNPTSSITVPLKLNLPEGIQLVNANETINATIKIEKVVTRIIDISAIEYRNLQAGLVAGASPERHIKLTVRGPEGLVNNAETAIDLYVDLTNAKEGQGTYQLMWSKPPMLEILEVTPLNIGLDIKAGE